jgi:hypothetical protein
LRPRPSARNEASISSCMARGGREREAARRRLAVICHATLPHVRLSKEAAARRGRAGAVGLPPHKESPMQRLMGSPCSQGASSSPPLPRCLPAPAASGCT